MTFVNAAGNASTSPAPGSRWLARCQRNPIYWPSDQLHIPRVADALGAQLGYNRSVRVTTTRLELILAAWVGAVTAYPAHPWPIGWGLGRWSPEKASSLNQAHVAGASTSGQGPVG